MLFWKLLCDIVFVVVLLLFFFWKVEMIVVYVCLGMLLDVLELNVRVLDVVVVLFDFV